MVSSVARMMITATTAQRQIAADLIEMKGIDMGNELAKHNTEIDLLRAAVINELFIRDIIDETYELTQAQEDAVALAIVDLDCALGEIVEKEFKIK